MTSEQKVREKYPNADILHRRTMGLTAYVVRIDGVKYRRTCAGEGFSKSKAWVDAAKNIAAGKEPYYF